MKTDGMPTCEIDGNLLSNFEKYNYIKGFSSGVGVIDSYYKGSLKRALKSENINAIGAVVQTGEVAGFCTVTLADIERKLAQEALSDTNLPIKVPVIRIVMLGVDVNYQGLGIGQQLLMEAFKKAARVHKEIPIKGIYLDSAPNAVSFYEQLGFKKLAEPDVNGSTPMLLGIKVVLKAIAAS